MVTAAVGLGIPVAKPLQALSRSGDVVSEPAAGFAVQVAA